jgi:hypothetical protein
MQLFEVNVKNRVTKKSFRQNKRIRGTQGEWYAEKLYYLADSEEEAKEFAIEQIKKRRIIGVLSWRKKDLRREIQIIDIGRIA